MESVPLPKVTHLQFLVLDIVARRSEGLPAPELRAGLCVAGEDQQGPKFYQLMRRLEADGLLTSWNQPYIVAGGRISRTCYRVTEKGAAAHRVTLQFYETRLKNGGV